MRVWPAVFVVAGAVVALPAQWQTIALAQAQAGTSPSRPEFEVASIKPNKSAFRGGLNRFLPGGRLSVTHLPLKAIQRASPATNRLSMGTSEPASSREPCFPNSIAIASLPARRT
jgi:hypothetical protein